ncbi:hypothetical protein [Pedosphaera parvula]|uniref:Uncharacterized protein n=1 Tax=Pedosphaera parvula (strain Ellin514) TaxID=320771 RepID=B9XL90_PEDPL|nr:hypothetical protein [Pedosphaera parvula]EEF59441.1 hypothetical protein Cflav_PD2285 [Pedosphaera parvula Ellin514]
MKSASPAKHFILAFLIALVLYVVFYTTIEHRRTRNGPWRVTFSSDTTNAPIVIINEPKLNISNVRLVFPNMKAPATNATVVFDPPRPVPFDLPIGQCIFLDTTFQPGTVVFNIFGHEIQLIPRVLTIDKKEYPWQSDATIPLTEKGILQAMPKP